MADSFDDLIRTTRESRQRAQTNVTATAVSPDPAQSPTNTFSLAEGRLAEGVGKEYSPTAGQTSGGSVKETSGSETVAADSDAVKIAREQEQYKMETALRLKGVDTALALWKDRVDDERRLRDRELDFNDWGRRYAIQNRDKMIERLSGARDVQWTYHGAFANGRFQSSFSGMASNPYKDVIQSLGSQQFAAPQKEAGLGRKDKAPDWLLPLLPDGGQGSDRKSSVELDVAPNAQSAATAEKETVPHSTAAAKKETVPYLAVTAYSPDRLLLGGRRGVDGFRAKWGAKWGDTLFRPKQGQSDTGTATVRRVR